MIIYVVKQGDTIYSIAQRFGVSWEKIIKDNMLTHPEQLVVGQTIVILADQITYTIQPGDRLTTIANAFGISVADLLRANPQVTPTNLRVGDVLTIPLPSQNLGTMRVNGFVFPFTKPESLDLTLPNLTYNSIFSYDVRPDGSLMGIPDDMVLEQTKKYGVAPLMVITNIEQDGVFSGAITNELFASPQSKQNLIQNVLNVMNQKGYYGLIIDFEYVYPEDRENYNQFLREITTALHENNYIVMTALAPKVSDEMTGALYQAHDYAVHGQIADFVIVMTYEWGYLYGPPLAISPINEVKRVLDYAVTRIPRNKILMGMPNYGYDWTLPFERGTAARILTNTGAVNLAREKGAFIQYDERAQAPYFNYWTQTNEHRVWFEDARSIDAKLRLVNQYGLAGVSYWNLDSYFPQNWLVQNQLYDVLNFF